MTVELRSFVATASYVTSGDVLGLGNVLEGEHHYDDRPESST
jgi:hypothetical protein